MHDITQRYRRASAIRMPWRARNWLRPRALALGRYLQPLVRLAVRPDPATHTLLAVGDIAACKAVGAAYRTQKLKAWGSILEVLENADICIGNLEAVLTDQRDSSIPCGAQLRTDPQFVECLAGVFDGMTTANNHVFDYGPLGLLESKENLEAAGIQNCGSGRNVEEARKPCKFNVRGLRVGMLGYCDRPGGFIEDRRIAVAAPCEEETVCSDIADLRAEVDLLVVQIHWGYEFSLLPLASHKKAARSFIDAGADLVLCHHAHVMMGLETYGRGAIAYGLGNFLFPQDDYQQTGSPWTKRGMLLSVEFDRQGICSLQPIPVEMGPDFQIQPLEDVGKREMLGVLGKISRDLEDCAQLQLIEHHCRTADTLSFMERFNPWQETSLAESLYRANLLDCPVWKQNIDYLKSVSPTACETANIVAQALKAVQQGSPLQNITDRGSWLTLQGRFSQELDLLPYQPATTPWWLL